ncbi:MAG: dTDP-4-dehydrorhamnose reductase [Oscillospiraceae bacterium]|nr:dTDP-4-dehydrorhamnose reductase [Oscillospiraceae bacterium]
MTVLVTGAQGQLGFDVCKELRRRSVNCVGVDREDFDLADSSAIRQALRTIKPDFVVHCAAYTAVDRAEDEPQIAKQINTIATQEIAAHCGENNIWMIYISTDYVFDGGGNAPWTVEDIPNPLSVYGVTKLGGELGAYAACKKLMIVRTSWVFGQNGSNFVKTMLRLSKSRPTLNVVCDQIGAPTYTVDLARLLCDMIEKPVAGIYHAANEGACSWADFAKEIFAQTNAQTLVNPIPSSAYPQKAVRPKNSRLSLVGLDRAGYQRLPHWRDALRLFLREME